MSAEKLYPDARYTADGRVVDFTTGEELPNYAGLCYAMVEGWAYILYTWPDGSDRMWDVVHRGGVLIWSEIDRYLAKKAKCK